MVDLERRLEALERKQNQMVRVCIVESVQPKAGTVKVTLPDSDGVVSQPLKVLFERSADNASYDMPDKGEQVVCIFLANGMETGFVLGSFFSSMDPVPVSSADKKHYRFKDGTTIEYDRAAHKLSIDVVGGDVEVVADKNVAVTATTVDVVASAQAKVVAPEIVLEGNISSTGGGGGVGTEIKMANTTQTGRFKLIGGLEVDGGITATGTIMDGSGNSNNHDH